jgi:hypothetical protein
MDHLERRDGDIGKSRENGKMAMASGIIFFPHGREI